jgi:C4-dicarboxylate transporter DctQ subunit
MRWLEHLEEGLIAFLMAAMTIVTFMQVVARYVFNYSFVWALELTGVMFAWLIFVVLCIVYAAIVFVGGFTYVRKMYDVGILMQDIPIQQWIPRVILPLGFALLAFRFAQLLYRLATGGEAHLLGDEAADALKLRQDQPEETGK